MARLKAAEVEELQERLQALRDRTSDLEGRLISATVKKSLHMVGTVESYNIKKGYGFINHNTSEDIFVHHTGS